MIGVNRRRVMNGHDEIIMTSETNPEMLAVCYAQGWCANPNYMYKDEAEAVTDIGNVFRSSNVKSLDELVYFTGLRTIYNSAFRNMTQFSGRIYIPEGVTQVEGSIVAYTGGVSALILPSTLLSINSSFRSNSNANVVFQNETIPVISDGTTRLGAVYNTSQLYYVPDNSRDDYQPIMPSNMRANQLKNLSEFDW